MKRVFNIKKLLLFLVTLIIICASITVGVYFYLIGAPNNNSESKVIYIEEGSSYSTIATKLKENNLIKSELAYKIYIKLNPPKQTLEYGEYVLKTNYDVEEMISAMDMTGGSAWAQLQSYLTSTVKVDYDEQLYKYIVRFILSFYHREF